MKTRLLSVLSTMMLLGLLPTVSARAVAAPENIMPPLAEDTASVDTAANHNVYVKTNALALGLIIANAAVEVNVQPHWSVNLPIYYSAWDYFKHTLKFRTFSFFPEVRYWPRTDYAGWFANAHVGLAWYNVALDGSLRTQDHDGHSPAYGGGLGFGYRKPLGNGSRWSLEFAFGIGAYGLYYDQWYNERGGRRRHSRHRAYVGPDQAALSIVYRIYNKRRK